VNHISSRPHVGQTGLSAKVRYFPIVFFELFLLFTVVIFAFGPWDWPVANPWALYSFVLLNQVALLVGYMTAIRKLAPVPFRIPFQVNLLMWASALVVLVLLIPTTSTRTGGDINVVRALTDPGAAYAATRDAVSNAPRGYVEYVRMLCSPLIWPLLPLTVVFWNRLSQPLKWLSVIGISGEAFVYVLIGTNKGIVDIMLLAPWLFLLRSIAAGRGFRLKLLLRCFLVTVVAFALFLPFFGSNIVGRGSTGSVGGVTLGGGAMLHPTDIGSEWLDSALWKTYGLGYMALSGYVGQGYYGLSLALDEPFAWTYGVGHSRVLTWLAEKAFTDPGEIDNQTYPSRIEARYGWDSKNHWATLYPWLASDVTFVGVPIVVFLIGRLFAMTWLDAIGGNPVAVVLFSLTVVMISYISANSQLFQASDTVFVFYFYLLWWMQSRLRITVWTPGPVAHSG
jgi:hypothetical protein